MRTGTILRNIGRPTYDCENKAWIYSLSTECGGYMIGSIEYQGRGLVHAHLAWREERRREHRLLLGSFAFAKGTSKIYEFEAGMPQITTKTQPKLTLNVVNESNGYHH